MSFTRLRYHIVWSTKRRRKLLIGDVEGLVYSTLRTRAEELGTYVLEGDGFEDHVHLVMGIPPTLSVSMVVGQLKSASSKAVRSAFPDIDFKWQKGFAALTLRAWDFDDVCFYVRRQKERHREGTLDEHLEALDSED